MARTATVRHRRPGRWDARIEGERADRRPAAAELLDRDGRPTLPAARAPDPVGDPAPGHRRLAGPGRWSLVAVARTARTRRRARLRGGVPGGLAVAAPASPSAGSWSRGGGASGCTGGAGSPRCTPAACRWTCTAGSTCRGCAGWSRGSTSDQVHGGPAVRAGAGAVRGRDLAAGAHLRGQPLPGGGGEAGPDPAGVHPPRPADARRWPRSTPSRRAGPGAAADRAP